MIDYNWKFICFWNLYSLKNAFDKENYNLYDEIVVNRSVHFESKSIKCKQNIFLENPIELLLLLYNGQ